MLHASFDRTAHAPCLLSLWQIARPVSTEYQFRTSRKVPKMGLMLVGLGGNNGSTCVAGVLANKHKMEPIPVCEVPDDVRFRA